MKDQLMAESRPQGLGNLLHQIEFDFDRIIVSRETEPS
jgi:hypothetical protein